MDDATAFSRCKDTKKKTKMQEKSFLFVFSIIFSYLRDKILNKAQK